MNVFHMAWSWALLREHSGQTLVHISGIICEGKTFRCWAVLWGHQMNAMFIFGVLISGDTRARKACSSEPFPRCPPTLSPWDRVVVCERPHSLRALIPSCSGVGVSQCHEQSHPHSCEVEVCWAQACSQSQARAEDFPLWKCLPLSSLD